jgi:hypothetical protein
VIALSYGSFPLPANSLFKGAPIIKIHLVPFCLELWLAASFARVILAGLYPAFTEQDLQRIA